MKVIDFIICDDIRKEMGNKFSLAGIYNERIRLEAKDISAIKFPLPFRLGVFVRLLLGVVDQNAFDDLVFVLDVKFNGEQLFRADATTEPRRDDQKQNLIIGIPFMANFLLLKGPGKIQFNLVAKSAGKEILQFSPEYDFTIDVVKV
jgi:hypothetical protein